MSQGLNRAFLIGNLGADPELKYTKSNQAVLRMRLATTESFAGQDGERQDRTEWHTVCVWGRRAEGLSKILEKGRSVYVEGRIQYRSWEDRDGNKRTSTEINATNIVLLGGGARRGEGDGERGRERDAGRDDFGGYYDDGFSGDVPF